MPANTDYAIIEIGMNHPGEIAPLARLARPHVAMITTVAAAHLEAFADVTEIAREKAAICEGLEPGGIAVLNADIAQASILTAAAWAAGATVVTFGSTASAMWRLTDLRTSPGMSVAQAHDGNHDFLLKVASEGRHFALNALGAIATATALGADMAQTLCGLATWSPPAGRGARETITLDPVERHLTLTLLDDAYNANPASMIAALDVLAGSQVADNVGRVGRGRRIAFLGDMKELGQGAEALHAELARLPALEHIDKVHCIGPLMAYLHAALPADKRGELTQTAAQMAALVPANLDAGDAVLAKGSLSMGLSRIVDAVRKLGHPPR